MAAASSRSFGQKTCARQDPRARGTRRGGGATAAAAGGRLDRHIEGRRVGVRARGLRARGVGACAASIIFGCYRALFWREASLPHHRREDDYSTKKRARKM